MLDLDKQLTALATDESCVFNIMKYAEHQGFSVMKLDIKCFPLTRYLRKAQYDRLGYVPN